MTGYDIITLAKILRVAKTELPVEPTIKWWEFTALIIRKANEILDVVRDDNPEAKERYLSNNHDLSITPFLSNEELYGIATINKWETGISLALMDILVVK